MLFIDYSYYIYIVVPETNSRQLKKIGSKNKFKYFPLLNNISEDILQLADILHSYVYL